MWIKKDWHKSRVKRVGRREKEKGGEATKEEKKEEEKKGVEKTGWAGREESGGGGRWSWGRSGRQRPLQALMLQFLEKANALSSQTVSTPLLYLSKIGAHISLQPPLKCTYALSTLHINKKYASNFRDHIFSLATNAEDDRIFSF